MRRSIDRWRVYIETNGKDDTRYPCPYKNTVKEHVQFIYLWIAHGFEI